MGHLACPRVPGSFSELTENRGHFITKVFISIQFTNRLFCLDACICSQQGVCGQTPRLMVFPPRLRAKTFRPGQRCGGLGGRGLERNHTLSPEWRKGASAHVSEGDTLVGWYITVNDPGPGLGSQRRNWALAI